MKYTFIVFFLFSFGILFSKESSLKVIDSKTREPLVAATVHYTIKNSKGRDSTLAIQTDLNGIAVNRFNASVKYIVTYAAYKSATGTLAKDETKTIELEQSSYIMDEIVTTGQFQPQTSQKSIYKVDVINREKIEAKSASNLRDLLQAEMNVRLSNDNVLGSSLSINGIDGQNVKVMIDGVPVIGRLNGNIDLSQINLNNAQKVEIIEGPMSAVYGSDALGGVINIITKDPMCERFQTNINSYYESVGVYNFDGDFTYNMGTSKLFLSGGRNFFGGYSTVDTSRNKRWKPKEQYFADLNYSLNFDDVRLKYSGRYFHEFILNRGALRPPYYETAFDDKYFTDRLTNSLSLKAQIGTGQFLDGMASYSYYRRQKNTYYKNMIDLSEKLTTAADDQDTSYFDTWLMRGTYSYDKLLAEMNLQTGFDITIDNASGKKIGDANKSVGDYAAFLSLQYSPLEELMIQPSIRIVYNTKYDAPIIPSVNIKYGIIDNLTLRASYARGFRAPSIKELYFLFVDVNHNIQGNDNLKAETSNSFNTDLTYVFAFERSVLKLETNGYYNFITDLITLANVSSDLYSYINIGDYKTLGTGWDISYYSETINFAFGWSYLGRYNQISEATAAPEFDFTNEFKGEAGYTIPSIETRLSVYYKYTGRTPSFGMNSDNSIYKYYIEDYHTLDASATTKLFSGLIEITAGVKNLFDVKNIKAVGIGEQSGIHVAGVQFPIAWGRTFFAKMKISIEDILD